MPEIAHAVRLNINYVFPAGKDVNSQYFAGRRLKGQESGDPLLKRRQAISTVAEGWKGPRPVVRHHLRRVQKHGDEGV